MISRKPNRLTYLLIVCLNFSIFTSCTKDDDESNESQIRIENFSIDAKSTFLRTDDSDNPSKPLVINLSEFEIFSGDLLTLKTIGNFINSPGGSTRDDAVGVFSSSSQLLDKSELNRVVDAIDAGEDRLTENTFEQNLVTDILQDFRIDENQIEVRVPQNAQFLFVGNADSKQLDNSESTGFSLEVKY